ncbi:superfamily II DNA or RNA helicase [Mycetocola sp. CAN_C7]|uniref:DEAD/DEAH box helicase n=1 Tax=Mycetocola sp. CAN_C7 TaxID=2787724 RepID=UPI0018CA08FD
MSPAAAPLVDVTDIIRLVGNAAFNRATAYARSGAVADLDWDDDERTLTATVQGSAPNPYDCRIALAPARKDFSRPSASSCTCPLRLDCKHVAAVLLASNSSAVKSIALPGSGLTDASPQDRAWIDRQMREADAWWQGDTTWPSDSWSDATGTTGIRSTGPDAGETDRAVTREPAGPPLPAWKSAVGALTGQLAASDSPSTPMGLQFELREQTPHTRHRWNGPTARTARSTTELAEYRLGVRPVIRNTKGNWVRTNVGWNTFSYQVNRLGLDPVQHRWFSQFAALHRAARSTYAVGQDLDWLYLDDFSSPLLWNLLTEARTLGIELVGVRKDAVVSVGALATVSLDATADTDLRLDPTLTIDGELFPPASAGLLGDHGVYAYTLDPVASFTLAPTDGRLTDEQRRLIGRSSSVVVPAADIDEFFAEFYPKLRHTIPVTSTDATVEFPPIVPPVLVLTAAFSAKHTLSLGWDWEYVESGRTSRMPLYATAHDSGLRDLVAEHAIADRARAITSLEPQRLVDLDAAEFTDKILPGIESVDGVRVDVIGERPDYRELTEAPKLKITTVETDQRDWFDLGVLVTIDGQKIPFGPLFKALSKGQTKLLLVDNSYLSLKQPAFEQLHELIEEARALAEWDTGLRISRYQSSLWEDLEDLADESEQAASWQSAVTGLRDLTALDTPPLPAGIRATLRPYQLDGFAWLAFLWQHQLGGILADDMGLGKTLQTLALIEHAKESTEPAKRRPFLVVAPTSVVSNWQIEAERFAPGLAVRTVAETRAKRRSALAFGDADVVITSYALFRLDFDTYAGQEWAGLILDEAQFVKNRTAKVHQAARDLDVPFKLAITGTPMENNLLELWSLFAIVAPGLFPSARRFLDEYAKPIEAGNSSGLLARMRRRIRPLMMRRTKEIVATDLPAKQEQVLTIDLNPKHKKLYETFLQRERQKLLGLLDDMDKNRFIVFRSLTLLRMLSLDASLVDDAYASIPSSKLDALFEQLEDVLAEGHRALIFSQFTSFLGKAAARLDAEGIPYAYLDGSTTNRADVIARFKDGAAPIFLISLKAGGFGLNLTEADYVFLLDPWWNPATEAQAVDRTHRIGQTKNVMVYRMVANGTIEEKVMALKAQKAKLFHAVMDDDSVFSSALTADDVRGLLDE